MTNQIEISNLSKNYGENKAVDNVSFSIKDGELFGLLGPNGSGKTTIIKMITGQIQPTEGNINVLNIDVLKNPIKTRRKVGIIPEQETPPSFLTSEEYLEFVGKIRGIPDIEKKSDYWFNFLNFKNQKTTLCKDLSRGTRQKLMVAQAFLHEPKIAFIDEPLINLDPIVQRKLKDYLKDYVKKGNTIFFSTHVLEIAEEICTSIGILDKGKIIYNGPIDEIRKENKQNLEEFFLRLVKD